MCARQEHLRAASYETHFLGLSVDLLFYFDVRDFPSNNALLTVIFKTSSRLELPGQNTVSIF